MDRLFGRLFLLLVVVTAQNLPLERSLPCLVKPLIEVSAGENISFRYDIDSLC